MEVKSSWVDFSVESDSDRQTMVFDFPMVVGWFKPNFILPLSLGSRPRSPFSPIVIVVGVKRNPLFPSLLMLQVTGAGGGIWRFSTFTGVWVLVF